MTVKKNPTYRTRNIILISIIGLLIAFRIALPYIVLNYVNKTLADIEEYYGHVEDIDIALIRGAYVIRDIELVKINKDSAATDTIPFFKSPTIDLSVEWKAIFKGSVVGEIKVDRPMLNFVAGKHKDEDVKQDTADFREVIRELMPLTINRFEITRGEIHYIDKYSTPRVDISLKDIEAVATNLTNVNDSSKLLPAHLDVSANAYQGNLKMKADFNIFPKDPTFDMNATITNVHMVMLNDFFKAYGKFDLKEGSFGLYTEFAAKEGKFSGYVKPLIKDLDIVQLNKEEGSLPTILWESVVGTVAEVFQNQFKEQLATKIPISGKFEKPDTNLWNAIVYVLRNAFVHALQPSIDQSIDIGKVEDVENKKSLFGKKDKDGKENDNKKKQERAKRGTKRE